MKPVLPLWLMCTWKWIRSKGEGWMLVKAGLSLSTVLLLTVPWRQFLCWSSSFVQVFLFSLVCCLQCRFVSFMPCSIPWEGYTPWLWLFLGISLHVSIFITKTRLFKYIENFTTKNWKCSDKKFWYFHISAQNIDCGYSLEPPRRGGSNEYQQSMFWAEIRKIMCTPVNPSFTI